MTLRLTDRVGDYGCTRKGFTADQVSIRQSISVELFRSGFFTRRVTTLFYLSRFTKFQYWTRKGRRRNLVIPALDSEMFSTTSCFWVSDRALDKAGLLTAISQRAILGCEWYSARHQSVVEADGRASIPSWVTVTFLAWSMHTIGRRSGERWYNKALISDHSEAG